MVLLCLQTAYYFPLLIEITKKVMKFIPHWIFRPLDTALIISLLTPIAVHASPTEQEYIKLLQGSFTTHGGSAAEQMKR